MWRSSATRPYPEQDDFRPHHMNSVYLGPTLIAFHRLCSLHFIKYFCENVCKLYVIKSL